MPEKMKQFFQFLKDKKEKYKFSKIMKMHCRFSEKNGNAGTK